MARSMLVSACLLATLVAGAMPGTAGDLQSLPTPQEVAAYGPACAKSDDDAGWGGTSVTCYYSCGVANLLGIGASASDRDATTYGDTSCGGTNAVCRPMLAECVGASEGPTEYASAKAACRGYTDEFWSSPVTVACASHGTDPESVLCRLVKDLCEGGVDVPDVEVDLTEVGDDLAALCQQVLEEVPDVVGLVLARIGQHGFSAVTLQGDACVPSLGSF